VHCGESAYPPTNPVMGPQVGCLPFAREAQLTLVQRFPRIMNCMVMPFYFFHLDEARDNSGTDLPHDAAAHQSAVQMLGQMMCDGTALADSG
jgi:hypothetical protein